VHAGSGEPVVAGLLQRGERLFEQLAGPRVLVLQCQEVTQHGCRRGCAQHVPGLAVQRQALLQQRLRCGPVPGREEAEAGAAQRQGTLPRRQVSLLGRMPT
jgi:hypothetical protein